METGPSPELEDEGLWGCCPLWSSATLTPGGKWQGLSRGRVPRASPVMARTQRQGVGCSRLGSLEDCVPVHPLWPAPRPQGHHLHHPPGKQRNWELGSCLYQREPVNTPQEQRGMGMMERSKAPEVLGAPLPLLNCYRRVN